MLSAIQIVGFLNQAFLQPRVDANSQKLKVYEKFLLGHGQ